MSKFGSGGPLTAVGDKKGELPIFYAISFYQIPFFNGGWQLQLRYFSQTQKKNLGALKMKVALLRSFNHPAGVRNGKEWTTGKLRKTSFGQDCGFDRFWFKLPTNLFAGKQQWVMGQLLLNDTAGSHLMQIYMKLTFVSFDR